MSNAIETYYDDFANRQVDMGVNERNLKIQEWALEFGMKPNHRVLEIGCGIGTQTELIAKYISSGNITAIDISPKSIEIAKKRLRAYKHVEMLVGDIVTMSYEPKEKFDFVVLPDVIEHIPLASHQRLFERLRLVIKEDATILIHIPNPNFLQWVHENRPDLLQILDQPVYTDEICRNIYPCGLYIYYLQTYPIWVEKCDYQVIVLKTRNSAKEFSFKKPQPSFTKRLRGKIKSLFHR